MVRFLLITYCVLHGVALLMICYIAIVLYKSKNKPRNKVHFYVARDKSGMLWLYMGKPFRDDDMFCNNLNKRTFVLTQNLKRVGLKYEDYDYLNWEDEPVEVFLNLEE